MDGRYEGSNGRHRARRQQPLSYFQLLASLVAVLQAVLEHTEEQPNFFDLYECFIVLPSSSLSWLFHQTWRTEEASLLIISYHILSSLIIFISFSLLFLVAFPQYHRFKHPFCIHLKPLFLHGTAGTAPRCHPFSSVWSASSWAQNWHLLTQSGRKLWRPKLASPRDHKTP